MRVNGTWLVRNSNLRAQTKRRFIVVKGKHLFGSLANKSADILTDDKLTVKGSWPRFIQSNKEIARSLQDSHIHALSRRSSCFHRTTRRSACFASIECKSLDSFRRVS